MILDHLSNLLLSNVDAMDSLKVLHEVFYFLIGQLVVLVFVGIQSNIAQCVDQFVLDIRR